MYVDVVEELFPIRERLAASTPGALIGGLKLLNRFAGVKLGVLGQMGTLVEGFSTALPCALVIFRTGVNNVVTFHSADTVELFVADVTVCSLARPLLRALLRTST